jgi:hypothetical protein
MSKIDKQFSNYPELADLFVAKQLVYDVCGFNYSFLSIEPESLEYGACTLRINDFLVRFRIAKITPKKIGQFVTLWTREKSQQIKPFDLSVKAELFVVSTRSDNNFGQFVFPKIVLFQKGIISKDGKGGKRAMRVYPPWDKPTSKQALATQKWQLRYFFEVPKNSTLNCSRASALYYKIKNK